MKSACSIGPIPTYSGEAGKSDDEHVYLRSISSFLQLAKVNWVYEGKVRVYTSVLNIYCFLCWFGLGH